MHPAVCTARVALGLIALLLCASTASAQPAGYVSGSVFADVREFGSTSAVPYYGDQFALDATGLGGGVRIGTFLHPRWSLELSAEAGSRTTVDLGDAVRILIFPPPRLDFRASTRFVTVTTSVAFHPPAVGRVRLGYRVGFSFVRGTYKSDYPSFVIPAAIFTREAAGLTFPTVLPPPQFGAGTITQEHNTGALTIGFESAIDMTRRIAVVPEVRALVFSAPNNGPGVFLIRPGIGVRWKF
jgi:hypothetical protein